MKQTERVPATIVTGFLGAGKTTLIRNLIAQANGRRIALIVNEFGDMGFDGELAATASAARARLSSLPMAASAARSPRISCRRWRSCSRAPRRRITS
jgi:hypothetical protein